MDMIIFSINKSTQVIHLGIGGKHVHNTYLTGISVKREKNKYRIFCSLGIENESRENLSFKGSEKKKKYNGSVHSLNSDEGSE